MQERNKNSALPLALLVGTLALYLLLWQYLSPRFSLPVYYYGRMIEVLATLLFLLLALFTPMDFAQMGILSPRATLLRSLAAGGGVALLVVVGLALFSLATRGGISFSWQVAGGISRATYILVAPFQEILAKSVMLYSLERCFDGKHPHAANLLAALVFGAFHVVYGLRMMLLAMLLCYTTGLLFLRCRSVWGCAVMHFALGFFPPCFGFS